MDRISRHITSADFDRGGDLDILGAQPIDACGDAIEGAVEAIRAEHDQTAIVLVGLFDNAEAPVFAERWRSAAAMRNRQTNLDRFDGRLRAITAKFARVSVFDDRAWFRARWGGRDEAGVPHYREVRIGTHAVNHRVGDDPGSTTLTDGHAGLAVNLLWAQSLAGHLAEQGVAVESIPDGRVEREFAARYAVPR